MFEGVGAAQPLVVGGDGLFWSQAGSEIKEFVELTGIPIYIRRAGQGDARVGNATLGGNLPGSTGSN